MLLISVQEILITIDESSDYFNLDANNQKGLNTLGSLPLLHLDRLINTVLQLITCPSISGIYNWVRSGYWALVWVDEKISWAVARESGYL